MALLPHLWLICTAALFQSEDEASEVEEVAVPPPRAEGRARRAAPKKSYVVDLSDSEEEGDDAGDDSDFGESP